MKKIRKPDITNENPQYWERVLESHGLGERQLGLQEVPVKSEHWKGTMEEVDE